MRGTVSTYSRWFSILNKSHTGYVEYGYGVTRPSLRANRLFLTTSNLANSNGNNHNSKEYDHENSHLISDNPSAQFIRS